MRAETFFLLAALQDLIGSALGILFPTKAAAIFFSEAHAEQCNASPVCLMTTRLLFTAIFAAGFGCLLVSQEGSRRTDTAMILSAAGAKVFYFIALTYYHTLGMLSMLGFASGVTDLVVAIGFLYFHFRLTPVQGRGKKP